MPAARALLVLASAGLAACGSATTSSQSCTPVPSATATPPAVTAGAVTLAGDRARVARGGQVALTATATGPVTFSAPCSGPVSLVVTDPTGIHVFSDSPAAQPGTACGSVALAAGQAARYDLSWTVDPTLPSGRYAVAVTVGSLPEVSVDIDVGGGVAGAPQC